MATLAIETTPGVPHSRQRVTLDGREYVLVLRWSQREEKWYLDLRDGNEAMLLGSIKLVVNFPLLRVAGTSAIAPSLPPGELMVADARPGATDPSLADLGGDAKLVYLDAAELRDVAASSMSQRPGAPRSFGRPPEATVSRNSDGVSFLAHCSPGTWSGVEPIRLTYQWLRAGVAIANAKERNYGVTPADRAARTVVCRVTATNAQGASSVDSNAADVS